MKPAASTIGVFSIPRAQSAANAQKTAIGEPSWTLKGSVQLTQSAALRNTKSSAPKTIAGETPLRFLLLKRNFYVQIGLVIMIGMAAKNAI